MKKTYVVSLNIGGTILKLHSDRASERFSSFHPMSEHRVFFNKFIYRGRRNPDIDIRVEIKDVLPIKPKARVLFASRHYLEDTRDWKLYRGREGFIYEYFLSPEKKLIYFNRSFNKVRVYLLPKHGKGHVWHWADVAFNFLQVLLTLYWARRGQASIIHGCGIKEANGSGLIFAGESGRGKSTIARFWHLHGQGVSILNDDRVIVRRSAKGFLVFGSPWNGDFNEYQALNPGPVKLGRIFFIRHARQHILRPIDRSLGFKMLYPAIFPVFWDKELLSKQLKFCEDLMGSVTVCSLSFRKDKSVVKFVRKQL
jgi:hypothetical protein